MELLDSEWFFRMVDHQKNPPAARLVAVFTVIGNWISAPGVREIFTAQKTALSTSRLKTYLIETAQSAKAHNPSMLAAQLLILLQGAIAEELRNPGVNAIESAAKAAQAVVSNACQPSRQKRMAQWSAVASVMVGLSAALIWQAFPLTPTHTKQATVAMQHAPYLRASGRMPMGVNPSDMEAILTLQEKFDSGICPAPHLLALPQGQMMAYMNVIHFRTPENPESDRENLHAFLVWFNQAQASECYYAPSNGHTTVSWVKS